MSQGAVRIVISNPNAAARVNSHLAMAPYPVPSAFWRFRTCTIRPIVIIEAAKLASNTGVATLNEITYITNRNRLAAVPDV
jgi:hypothetical protein